MQLTRRAFVDEYRLFEAIPDSGSYDVVKLPRVEYHKRMSAFVDRMEDAKGVVNVGAVLCLRPAVCRLDGASSRLRRPQAALLESCLPHLRPSARPRRSASPRQHGTLRAAFHGMDLTGDVRNAMSLSEDSRFSRIQE